MIVPQALPSHFGDIVSQVDFKEPAVELDKLQRVRLNVEACENKQIKSLLRP